MKDPQDQRVPRDNQGLLLRRETDVPKKVRETVAAVAAVVAPIRAIQDDPLKKRRTVTRERRRHPAELLPQDSGPVSEMILEATIELTPRTAQAQALEEEPLKEIETTKGQFRTPTHPPTVAAGGDFVTLGPRPAVPAEMNGVGREQSTGRVQEILGGAQALGRNGIPPAKAVRVEGHPLTLARHIARAAPRKDGPRPQHLGLRQARALGRGYPDFSKDSLAADTNA